MKNGINKLKDKALQSLVCWFINNKISKIGKVDFLQIDTINQNLSVGVLLKGEAETIEVRAIYSIPGQERIKIISIESSREWIVLLFNEFIEDEQKLIQVPYFVARALSKLLP